MTSNTTRRSAGLMAAAALALAVGALAPESDAKGDPRIYALKNGKAKILGTKASDWATQWNQWSTSLPVSVHPLFDETGERVEIGQRGPVWFLGGVYNESGSVVRTATIPTGRALFFPILNYGADNIPHDPPLTIEDLEEEAAEVIGQIEVDSLFCEVDGSDILDLARGRVSSGPHAFAFPDGNLAQYFGQVAPRGIYYPSISDGYWVMLRPLAVGSHTIHFGGSVGSFTLDVTYNLTVVESNQP